MIKTPKGQQVYTVEYNHNNSGGYDWVTKEQWHQLQDTGWTVRWDCWDFSFEDGDKDNGNRDRAYGASIDIIAESAEVAEFIGMQRWRDITNGNPDDRGCSCCGAPHYFSTELKENDDA